MRAIFIPILTIWAYLATLFPAAALAATPVAVTVVNQFAEDVFLTEGSSTPAAGGRITIAAGQSTVIESSAGRSYGIWTADPKQPVRLVTMETPDTGDAPWSYVITPTFITFGNFSNDPVDISWMPAEGQRVKYLTLQPLQSYVQGTYPGHVWMLDWTRGGRKTSRMLVAPVNLLNYPILLNQDDVNGDSGRRKRAGPRMEVDPDRRYDEQSYLMAHNAMANTVDGWAYAQQQVSIHDQLAIQGARALEIDVHWHDEGDGRGNQLYLCHDNCGGYDPNNWSRTIKGMFLTRFGANTGLRTFTQALTEIVRFLDERPEEIVTVFVEFGPVNSDLGDQRDAINRAFAAALRDSGADRQVYFPDLPTATNAGLDRATVFHSVNGTIGGDFDWPLVRDMRQRLVLFIDRGDRAMGGGLLPFTWRFVREIDYGDRGTAPHNLIVAERAESERWRAGRTNFQERPLSRFNHFVYFALPASAVDVHRQSNQRGWLLRRIIAYSRAGWTIPNFVAVDSIATGDAAEVVRAIDGCWRAADRAQCVQALTLARAPLSDAMRTDTVAPANMTIDGGELK